MPEKESRSEPIKGAVQRSATGRSRRATSGVTRPDTVADRIERIAAAPWRQVTILRSHAELLALDLADAVVYMDPPYQGCTRYAAPLGSLDETGIAGHYRRAITERHQGVDPEVEAMAAK